MCNTTKCVSQHITYLAIGETKVDINDFWLFGCKDFQAIWDRTIISTKTPFSTKERDILYFRFKAKGAVGIAAHHGAMIPKIIENLQRFYYKTWIIRTVILE